MILTYTLHDEIPGDDARIVDQGLGTANDDAAPLAGVRPLACFARSPPGTIVGGAIGRTWGRCCELQQLWVEPARRQRGIGARLVRLFEQRAAMRGCHRFYLDTFSFQAPAFYRTLGYEPALEIRGFPGDIVKCTMVRELAADATTGDVAPGAQPRR
jgi:GNAT superfamily N-acetyltransferase